jgi:hypothetical protein
MNPPAELTEREQFVWRLGYMAGLGQNVDNTGAPLRDEIGKLRDLLERADKHVVWETEPYLGRSFQTEIDNALGRQ